MSSEALKRAAHRKLVEGTEVLRTGGGASLSAGECNAILDRLGEVARLEQARDTIAQEAIEMQSRPTWEQFDALYARIDRAEAALAVAREREQAMREALAFYANQPNAHGTYSDVLEDGGDRARAALVDEPAAATSGAWSPYDFEEPAAATLAEPEGSVEEAHHGATVEARVATPPGSASAAAGEPQLPPCDCRANDWVEGDNGAIRCEQCGGYAGEPGTSIRVVPAAADEPGETPA